MPSAFRKWLSSALSLTMPKGTAVGNLELPMPNWWDDGQDDATAAPRAGGLLDGLPSQGPSNSLQLLMDPKDIATVEGLQDTAGDGQGAAPPLTIGQVDPGQLVAGRPDGDYLHGSGPKNPIGPVQGYPETGKDAWRAENDDAIVAAANRYNSEHGYSPGDAEYVSPGLMKAWQMRESGGNRQAFESDPFQVNKPGDWPKYDEKAKYAGLSQGQAMTPQTSADAALKWLQYKGTIHAADGSSLGYRGHQEALRKYNARGGFVNGIPRDVEYADDVLNRAKASYGDRQQ
jgi:hypothetical protein